MTDRTRDTITRAVHDAARRMRDWREHRLRGNASKQAHGAAYGCEDPPDAPLVRLRQDGVITVAQEARLTSQAYQRSLEL